MFQHQTPYCDVNAMGEFSVSGQEESGSHSSPTSGTSSGSGQKSGGSGQKVCRLVFESRTIHEQGQSSGEETSDEGEILILPRNAVCKDEGFLSKIYMRLINIYRLGVSQAQKAKVSGDERPRLRDL